MIVLKCVDCHWLHAVMASAQQPEGGHICRRHPADVSVQFLRAPQAPQVPRQLLELPGGPVEAQVVQYQMAMGAGNPFAKPEDAACGDFQDNTGRGYWPCYHEAVVKERQRARAAKQPA